MLCVFITPIQFDISSLSHIFRLAISLLRTGLHKRIACARCGFVVATKQDLFNVSGAEGLAAVYVNRYGYECCCNILLSQFQGINLSLLFIFAVMKGGSSNPHGPKTCFGFGCPLPRPSLHSRHLVSWVYVDHYELWAVLITFRLEIYLGWARMGR